MNESAFHCGITLMSRLGLSRHGFHELMNVLRIFVVDNRPFDMSLILMKYGHEMTSEQRNVIKHALAIN